jgi:L-arabinonolactonase
MTQLLVDAQARLGECVLWCDQSNALYWTDIESSTLSRWNANDGRTRTWPLPERVGSFALCGDPSQLLLGLASGIALFNLNSGAVSAVVPVAAHQPTTRINDGRCDPQGRFVFGLFNSEPAPIGHFYRVGADLQIETLPLPPATVANSIAFSPNGQRMYFADSPTRTIWQVEYHADGHVGTPHVFVQLGANEGYPDGSCIDADSGLWNAQWDGACVVRYGPDGRPTARLALPTRRLTCPAFGGPALDQLFVSTARIGLSEAVLLQEPSAGGIFALRPGHRGRPEHRFITHLRA